MSSYSEKIKRDLLDLHEGVYCLGQNDKAAVLFNSEVLKKIRYKPEEVKIALDLDDNLSQRKKQGISSEIAAIQTREQALEYFDGNLGVVFRTEIAENDRNSILKKVTVEELKHLYHLIFGIPMMNKCKKIDILYKIKEFCDNDKRTEDLIKNLY